MRPLSGAGLLRKAGHTQLRQGEAPRNTVTYRVGNAVTGARNAVTFRWRNATVTPLLPRARAAACSYARAAAITAVLALAFATAGCTSTPAVHGTITGKTYLPPITTYQSLPRYQQRCQEEEEEEPEDVGGREQEEPEEEEVCTNVQVGVYQVPSTTPECWQLTVTGPQGGTVCVTESQYDAAMTGGTW